MYFELYLRNPGVPEYYILGLVLVCAITDLRTGKIYNVVTYPSIAIGVLYSALFGDRGVMIASLVGLTFATLSFGLAACRGLIGGGDVKLFAAIGAIGGFFFLFDSLFNTFLIAAVWGLLLLLLEAFRTRPRRRRVRLGVFIFLGALLCVVRLPALGGS